VRTIAAGILIGLSAAGLVLGANWLLTALASGGGLQPLQAVEMRTYDWRLTHTVRPETARKDIALVEIDEYSLRKLQPNAGRWPWPRAVHSMLVDYLARAPAKVVAYDVVFSEPDTRTGFRFGDSIMSGDESDEAFADSLRSAGNVILEKGFGLSALRPLGGGDKEKQTAQVSASGGARGVGPDRLAKGGDNPNPVKVTVSAAEIERFRKGIS